jgi:DHA1 family multidrug resistance protein-like MFS transporter
MTGRLGPAPAEANAAAARAPTVVGALAASGLLEWFGAGAVLPLLPLYLRREGSSDALVGAVMAAFFVGSLAVQYGVGSLSDRVGRRPVQLAGLGTFAGASFLFPALRSPLGALVLRALQGAGAGTAQVATAALVGDVVPASWRGRAYGALYGGQATGLALGPLIGSLLGLRAMALVFDLTGVAGLLAAVPLLALLPPVLPRRHAFERHHSRAWRSRPVLGTALAMTAGGLLSGVYEVCWSLLLHLRHAASWQIGLSWTLFSVPYVAVALPAGWLVDHLDRRVLVVATLLGSAGFASAYPFLHSVALLIGLGAAESVLVALGYPAAMAELVELADPSALGEAQGVVAVAETGAVALAAAGAGALFGLAPWAPFLASAAAAAVLAALVPLFWHGAADRRTPPRRGTDAPR